MTRYLLCLDGSDMQGESLERERTRAVLSRSES